MFKIEEESVDFLKKSQDILQVYTIKIVELV